MRHILEISAAFALVGAPALAQDSVQNVSAAANASGAALAHLTTAGVQFVGGGVAPPLGVAGGASEVVGEIARAGGESLAANGVASQAAADRAITDSWGPLSVDNRVIVRPDPAPQVPFQAKGR